MRVELTDEQKELSRTADKLFNDAAREDPLPPDWDAVPVRLNRPLWSSLAKLGLLGLAVPDQWGGSGAGLMEQCVLAECAGAALPAVPFAGTAAVTAVLTAHGHDAAAGPALAEIVTGSRVAVPAWETFPRSVVPRRRGDALSFTGSTVSGTVAAPFGSDADLLLAYPDRSEAPVLVDLSGPGTRRTAANSLDVVEPITSVTLLDAPAIELTRGECPAAEILTVLAAELVGTGTRALDGAVLYAKDRRQFGRAIGSFQAIKHMLADRFAQLDAARLLVRAAASSIDDRSPDAETAARAALVAASDAAEAATADALQTHGGIGFTWEHPSHVLLKRTRARRSLLGSPTLKLDALAALLFAR